MVGRRREFVPARSLTTSKLTPDQPINRRAANVQLRRDSVAPGRWL